jgi:hypothetical protein
MNSKMVVLVWENPTYSKNRFKPNFAGFSSQYTTPVATTDSEIAESEKRTVSGTSMGHNDPGYDGGAYDSRQDNVRHYDTLAEIDGEHAPTQTDVTTRNTAYTAKRPRIMVGDTGLADAYSGTQQNAVFLSTKKYDYGTGLVWDENIEIKDDVGADEGYFKDLPILFRKRHTTLHPGAADRDYRVGDRFYISPYPVIGKVKAFGGAPRDAILEVIETEELGDPVPATDIRIKKMRLVDPGSGFSINSVYRHDSDNSGGDADEARFDRATTDPDLQVKNRDYEKDSRNEPQGLTYADDGDGEARETGPLTEFTNTHYVRFVRGEANGDAITDTTGYGPPASALAGNPAFTTSDPDANFPAPTFRIEGFEIVIQQLSGSFVTGKGTDVAPRVSSLNTLERNIEHSMEPRSFIKNMAGFVSTTPYGPKQGNKGHHYVLRGGYDVKHNFAYDTQNVHLSSLGDLRSTMGLVIPEEMNYPSLVEVDVPSMKGAEVRLVKIETICSKSHHNLEEACLDLTALLEQDGAISHSAHGDQAGPYLTLYSDGTTRREEHFFNVNVGRVRDSNAKIGVKAVRFFPRLGMCAYGFQSGNDVQHSSQGLEGALPRGYDRLNPDQSGVGHTNGHLLRVIITLETSA